MAVDILELAEFYAAPDGARARMQIVQKIDALWPDPQAEPVMGFGYVSPYADALWPDTDWHLCMPAQQGVLVEDRQAGTRAALVDESLLPLRDGALGRAIIIHGLEAANHSNALLSEIWRILVPNGRAIFVVPNRTGMWARRDATPFGAGRPFSRQQLRRQLKAAGFSIAGIRPALMLPPALPQFMARITISVLCTGAKTNYWRGMSWDRFAKAVTFWGWHVSCLNWNPAHCSRFFQPVPMARFWVPAITPAPPHRRFWSTAQAMMWYVAAPAIRTCWPERRFRIGSVPKPTKHDREKG